MKRSNSKTTASGSEFKAMKDAVMALPYSDLLERKEELQERLKVISIEPIKTKKPSSGGASSRRGSQSATVTLDGPDQVPMKEKTTDVHWDFVLKEMMWLATDFQAERKRQISMAKKIATGVKQYHKTRESRRLRELAEAELKRRRLAGKIGREVRGWWTKIERVIAYKQKLSADEERRKAMNKQLVTLVKQTERYTESLIKLPDEEIRGGSSSSEEDSDDGSEVNGNNKQKKRRKRKRSGITIEEALALGERTSTRKSKAKVIDYNRLHLKAGDDQIYGESTASDSGSDASYSPDENDTSDDETTLLEAELMETRERRLELKRSGKNAGSDANLSSSSFKADPRELQTLREEREMPIDDVLERYRMEMESTTLADLAGTINPATLLHSTSEEDDGGNKSVEEEEDDTLDDSPRAKRRQARNTTKKVTFAPSPPKKNGANNIAKMAQKHMRPPASDSNAKYDADDDADASDVEDFVDLIDDAARDDDGDGSDEFEADQDEVDDETTLIQEEQLPQEMTAQEEINLLKAENEMSVEELRKLYAGAFQDSEHTDDKGDSGEDNDGNDGDGERKEGVEAYEKAANGAQASEVTSVEPRKYVVADDAQPMDLEQAFNADADEEEVEGEEEFVPAAGTDVDDETTMEAEEKMGRDMSYEEELKLLQDENEIPVEQLRAMYAAALQADSSDEEREDAQKQSESNDGDTQQSSKQKARESATRMLLGGGEADGEGEEEEEFQPQEGEGIDDETTIDAEEKLGRDMSYEDEIALLNKENEMSVEELRAMYAGALANSSSEDIDGSEGDKNDEGEETEEEKKTESSLADLASQKLIDDGSDAGDDGEFVADETEADDETTLEAEERLGREMSAEEELAMLQRESETPIESLYEMYRKMEEQEQQQDGNGESTDIDNTENDSQTEEERQGTKRRLVSNHDDDTDAREGAKRSKHGEESDEGLAAIHALEASAERARRTVASRPFLLAPWVKLREYQQIGLNWLVSLQTRRLNGILADGKCHFDVLSSKLCRTLLT
jgi:hypothetical protein